MAGRNKNSEQQMYLHLVKIEDLISDEVLNGFIKENEPYNLVMEDENIVIKKGVA